ncbi:MAG TPA: hypothetical protein VK007_00540 [Acidimicrobiales bacterium]|nr:hypothetical protein [Acidimicrobiales bacterium]
MNHVRLSLRRSNPEARARRRDRSRSDRIEQAVSARHRQIDLAGRRLPRIL